MRTAWPRVKLLCLLGFVSACSPFAGFELAERRTDDGGQAVEGTKDAGADADVDARDVDVDASVEEALPSGPCPAAGRGTSSDPCLVRSCQQLQAMEDLLEAAYALDSDISCVGFGADDGAGFRPVGTRKAPFTGKLYGRGHVISGLTMSREASDEVGLFGVTQGATLQDFGLRDADVLGRSYVGPVVGSAKANTRIERVFAAGRVAGAGYVGGLVGDMIESTLRDGYSLADVQDQSSSGIPDSAGLLVGRVLHGSLVQRAYAQSRNDWSLAPLVGEADDADSRVEDCFYDCTAEGGLCRSYESEGLTSIAMTVPEHFVYAGWDYESPVWGVRGDHRRPCLAWEQGCAAYDVGTLRLAGAGTDAAPFEITRCEDLESMALDLDATYALQNDVDCAGFDFGDGYGFFPVGSVHEPFVGELRGGGHTISGLRIWRRDRSDVGLFARLGPGAVVRDLHFVEAVVLGDYGVGVLTGNGGSGVSVNNCSAQGVLATHALSVGGTGLIGNPLDTATKGLVDEVTITTPDTITPAAPQRTASSVTYEAAVVYVGADPRCLATLLTGRWAMFPASCLCASQAQAPENLSVHATGEQSGVVRVVTHPTYDFVLIELQRPLPLPAPVRLWEVADATALGTTLRCESPFALVDIEGEITEVSSTLGSADNSCGGSGQHDGFTVALPPSGGVSAGEHGAPCFVVGGGPTLLAGVLLGEGMSQQARVMRLDALRAWIAVTSGVRSRADCDADVQDSRFALEPHVFAGTPDDDALTLVADQAYNEPWFTPVILAQRGSSEESWTPLEAPYFDEPVRGLRGGVDSRGLGSPRRLLMLHYMDERHVRRALWYDAIDDEWLQREELRSDVDFDPFDYIGVRYGVATPRTGFDLAGTWPAFVGLDGRVGTTLYVDANGFRDLLVGDDAPRAQLGRKPSVVLDADGETYLIGYIGASGAFVTVAASEACATASAGQTAFCEGSSVVWDLPTAGLRDVVLAVGDAPSAGLWAVTADDDGSLRWFALDVITGHAREYGSLAVRSLTTPSVMARGGELWVATTGETWSARVAPLTACLGNSPAGF